MANHPDEGLALYLHIPFCRQRCAYCHFEIKVFHPGTDPQPSYESYLLHLERELDWARERHGDRPLASIFFGGGTPSQLPAERICALLEGLRRRFRLASDCEISMEVNPEDGAPAYLYAVRQAGITRLSFGVQSFADLSLQAIGRPHDASQALAALRASAQMAFPHGRSLDLMLGLPHQTSDSLQRDLELVHELGMEHLSVYMLEVDLPTPLDKRRRSLPMPSEDQQAEWFEQTVARLLAWGYRHYEISNFAKPGRECRHNLTYWRSGDYLGIGPAAHGRVGLEHRANHPRLREWGQAVAANGSGALEVAHWSPSRFQQERRIQALRLREGLALCELEPELIERLREFQAMGLVEAEAGRIRLTLKGQLLANEVFALFLD